MSEWQTLHWHQAVIDARVTEDGAIQFRSLHNGAACTLADIDRGIIIEDERRRVSLDILADMIDHDNGLRAKLRDGKGWDYTTQGLTGDQAVLIITTARRTTTTPERMADLTAVTFDDLLALIPGEATYEA